jgi:hypothetical protein
MSERVDKQIVLDQRTNTMLEERVQKTGRSESEIIQNALLRVFVPESVTKSGFSTYYRLRRFR